MLEPAKQKMRQVGGQAIDDAASRMGATGGDEHEESPLQQPGSTLASQAEGSRGQQDEVGDFFGSPRSERAQQFLSKILIH